MPIFDHKCLRCGQLDRDVYLVRYDDPHQCTGCGAAMRRVLGAFSVRGDTRHHFTYDPAEMNPDKDIEHWQRVHQKSYTDFQTPDEHQRKKYDVPTASVLDRAGWLPGGDD